MTAIHDLIARQRDYFNSNATKDIHFRIARLRQLRDLIARHEPELNRAIREDFGKSEFETFTTELSLIYHEIDLLITRLPRWSKAKRVGAGLLNFPAKSYIMPEPLGVTLVIGAWNYPIQLSLLPALTALAAGNTVMLKPSELPAHTANVLARLVNDHFAPEYFHVVQGDAQTTQELLEHHFDKIFFTGSIPVGRIVYQAAARHLTPVTLELGGKSPVFVMADCNIAVAARRIVWAKFLNAGQTCVAPDYLLVEKSIEERFIEALKAEAARYPQHPDTPADHYLQIINHRNFDRLVALIAPAKVCFGGLHDRENRFISPTLMRDVTFDDAVMHDEIFGPILPVLTFTSLDDAIARVKARPKPLSCYIYSQNKTTIDKILREVSFGGGAVNESLMHLASSNLPFGGVGASGMGSYHGKAGFDTFTHYKSILQKPTFWEPNLKYAPYSLQKLRLIRMLLR